MPKTPIDYSKTIIYRIVCKDPTIKECYVGSTTDFTRRKSTHKAKCNNNKYNYNIYQFIRENGSWDNWDMIQIEEFNAINHLDQLKRERYWLEFYKAILNTLIPSRTDPEYQKIYSEEHKEELAEKAKKYREENREHFVNYAKKYQQDHKEKIADYHKEYYEEHKEETSKNYSEKITCECGAICSKGNLLRHKTTKKHLTFTSNAINVGNSFRDISSIFNELKTDVF